MSGNGFSGLPWYGHLGFALIIAWVIVKIFALMRDKSPTPQAEFREARHIAERLSESDYFVQTASGWLFGSVQIVVKTADEKREVKTIVFPRRHRDIKAARRLQRMDRIALVFQRDPQRGVGKGEVAAYLRLLG